MHTVLIVEDDKKIAQVLREELEETGLGVLLAENGKEALEIMKSKFNRPELVVLELSLPIDDGFVLLERYLETLQI